MKNIVKILLTLSLALCLLTVSFGVVYAADAFNLMPTDDNGYTIVAGDGTVTAADGKLTIVNNADGDLRITIDNKTAFDLAALHTLHMDFNAEMSFKMAYYLVSDADTTSAWLNTSDNYADMFTITGDRAAAGAYNVNLKIADLAANVTDKSSVHFDQFIILLTGKGTFTLNTVEMTDGATSGAPVDNTTKADDTTTAAAATTTTVAKTTAASTDSAKTGDTSNAIVFAVVAAAAASAVTLSVLSKKSKA